MTHDEFAALLKDPGAAAARTGRFACFQMIPKEERIGTWRFAGTAENLADAFERCGALFNRVWPREDPLSGRAILLDMLDALEVSTRPWSSNGTPAEFELPADAKLVLLAEGGAPHDDVATAIFEVSEWGELLTRRIEDQPPPTPYCSAYVLEFYGALANNSGDQMGLAVAVRDLASLRACLEQFTKGDSDEDDDDGESGLLARARFELGLALGEAREGRDFALRVWTVQQGVAGEPLDVRPFVRVAADGKRSTLDALEPFAPGDFGGDLEVEVMWDAIESALEPLVAPLLEEDGELEFDNQSEETEWFVGPLTLGENIIEP